MEDENKIYAGFWKRFAAHLIDSLILNTIGLILFIPIYIVLIFFGVFGNWQIFMDEDSFHSVKYQGINDEFGIIMTVIIMSVVLTIISIILNWLYFAIMESSTKQATLGKMALRIKVTDLEGNRISFGKASGRFFGKLLSGLVLNIGYLMAGFTLKKQALHDILSNTLVVNDES